MHRLGRSTIVMEQIRITKPEKRTYKVEEIAEILEIGKSAAYNLVKKEYFNSIRVGKTIRISKKSFDAWLDSHCV